MASLTLDQADINRIEEIRQQFDPASHLVTADALEALNPQERKAAVVFMRELIRDELYGNLIFRTALKAAADHRVTDSEDTAYQRFMMPGTTAT